MCVMCVCICVRAVCKRNEWRILTVCDAFVYVLACVRVCVCVLRPHQMIKKRW
jgi:hypothetical protein